MIQDSTPWKDELIAVADRLQKKTTQKRWTERSGFLVERDLMVSAYSLRKLIDNYKVSDALAQKQFALERFELIDPDEVPDLFGRYSVWEYYDLEDPVKTVMPLAKVCNQIVHSWLWMLSSKEEDGAFDGLYVSSDTARKKWLYRIPIDDYIAVCREIGEEYVYSKTMTYGPGGYTGYTQILGKKWSDYEFPE
ncbi:hypothetical protein CH254_18085 [Rhodococcus sp. 06-412-2C]|uniref:hypothetical protein n=1 Tax=unclassified Rhodococcus (in: high G+C Gram-positive bacteria) TaxID=192944 RepID=UPI000B9A5A58|nr:MULTISPECIES: hypothetical protein [unclassified Rhodococcus (in: high G+C Gram-positive bacteria)]OZC86451.1 hypothetical protein CH254_18085 [Rhodococcus sp. 06-412-2C]OZD02151.1 hypothetical protein CH279_04270 [Rhodococcus sp. 06-412-2B]